MKTRDTRTDSGQYYPGGKVIPRQPIHPGGGSDADAVHYYAETRTAEQKSQARQNLGAMSDDTPIPDVLGKLPLRELPKYLHALSFDDTYPADAAWLYAQLGPNDLGRCSAVRRGGKLWRNYDWTFDNAAEFVVRVSGNATRVASVGVASVGARLTENDVMSGINSPYYKCLPGMTLDGINEKGVVAEINVDGGPKTGWHGTGANAIHILAAVRWVLDHGETAAQAAAYIAANVKQPTGDMNFHFMIADAEKTYIVENGVAHDVTNGTKVLTNYGVFDAAQAGGGKERYDLLADGADISAVNWTNAYQQGNDWHSDFDSQEQHAAAIEQWAEQGTDKEAHRGKTTTSGQPWWQSVHTTEYDFAAKTMRVAVQESGEYFTFAAGAKADVAWDDVTGKPQSFPPSEHAHAQGDVTGLADALAAKRDKTDEAAYDEKFKWTGVESSTGRSYDFTGEYPPFQGYSSSYAQASNVRIAFKASEGKVYGLLNDSVSSPVDALDKEGVSFTVVIPGWDAFNFTRRESIGSEKSLTHVLARRAKSAASALAKFDADGNLVPATGADVPHDATKLDGPADSTLTLSGKAADAKATGEALDKKADEFTEWVDDTHFYDDIFKTPQPLYDRNIGVWIWETTSQPVGDFIATGTDDSVSLYFISDGGHTFTATRKRVLRSGEALTPGLSAQGVPADANVRDLFSESDTSTAANPDLNNKVLQTSVNKLIDAKVGDVNAVLASALDGTEVA